MAIDKKIFALLAVGDPVKLGLQLTQVFPETHLSVGIGQWLLVLDSTMTTTEVSNKLGITGESEMTSAAIVLSVSNYFGRAPASVWEWLTAKMGSSDGAAG